MAATVISLVALIISAFSFYLASEKFRLDLYNKRFDIYVRTVKFYQAMFKSEKADEDQERARLALLQQDFIIASRESQFLFSPESGVYDLLSRLNIASFKITNRQKLPQELPAETIINIGRERADAVTLWNSSMETLEWLMAPYLNYHYTSSWSIIVAKAKQTRGRVVAQLIDDSVKK
jgi:hypothetical protein